MPASARFGRRVYISASGPGFPGGTLTGKSRFVGSVGSFVGLGWLLG